MTRQNSLLIGAGITTTLLLSSALCLAYWPEDYTPSFLHMLYLHSVYSSEDIKTIEQLHKYRQASKILSDEVLILEKRFQELQASTNEDMKSKIGLKKELLEYSNDIDHIYAKLDILPVNTMELRQRRKQIIDLFAQDTKRIDDMLSQLTHITF